MLLTFNKNVRVFREERQVEFEVCSKTALVILSFAIINLCQFLVLVSWAVQKQEVCGTYVCDPVYPIP